MNLSVGNITITSLEDLKKTFREKHDDYSFVTEIIDLFVDGDLEEYLKTCNSQDANNYLELLSIFKINIFYTIIYSKFCCNIKNNAFYF